MRWQLVAMTVTALTVLATGLSASPAVDDNTVANAARTVTVQRVSLRSPAVGDEAAMILVGTALIAVAAALRRAA